MSQENPSPADAIKQRFRGVTHPEHVEQGLRPILKLIQSEVELSPEEWQEVFEQLATQVEFREADWLAPEL